MDENSLVRQWFEAYSHDIYHYLVYYISSRDVEDLVQEVFLKALRRMDQFQGRSDPKTWLITIARHTAIDWQRKHRWASLLPDDFFQQFSSPDASPEQRLLIDENQQELYGVINQLRRPYRDVLMLRGILELNTEETAEVMGWSRDKVNVTFHRAKKSLREKYMEKGGEIFGTEK